MSGCIFTGIQDAYDDDITKMEGIVSVIIKELRSYIVDAKKNPING